MASAPPAILCLLALCSLAKFSPAQSTDPAVRVTVAMNEDGSSTTYQFDAANHKAVATTTNRAGKFQGRIRYTLDDGGRFATGNIFGPDDKLRFRAVYKYDAAGKLLQESQLGQEGGLRNKILYSYDAAGRQTGFSIYDAANKLISQTKIPAAPDKAGKKKLR